MSYVFLRTSSVYFRKHHCNAKAPRSLRSIISHKFSRPKRLGTATNPQTKRYKILTTVCHITVCHITVCHITVCHITVCHITVCHITVCHITVCHITVCHITVCHITVCHITVCHIWKHSKLELCPSSRIYNKTCFNFYFEKLVLCTKPQNLKDFKPRTTLI